MRLVWRPKYWSSDLPLMVMEPLPGRIVTRAVAVLRRPVPMFFSTDSSAYVQFVGQLGGMRVLGTRIYLQLAQHGATQRIVREHALDGSLNHQFRLAGNELLEALLT